MGTASGRVREGLYRRGHVQEARELEPGWLEPAVVVETRLEGCVRGMCEVGGKAMGGLQRWEEGRDLPGTHREDGWSPRSAGPMAPAASVAARKLSWWGSVTEQRRSLFSGL